MSYKPELRHPTRRYAAAGRRAAASATDHATGMHTQTMVNGDEKRFACEGLASSFTKGLPHDSNGLVLSGYTAFMEAINAVNPDEGAPVSFAGVATGAGTFKSVDAAGKPPAWRGWESPRTGHYFDLEGPDADAFGMAPAPEMGSAELTAEMAEVYAMALLRDVPFRQIADETGADDLTGITVAQVLAELKGITYFSDPDQAPSAFAKRRLSARLLAPDAYDLASGAPDAALPALTGDNLFRGSGPGAKAGPWVSQFMVLGNRADRQFCAPGMPPVTETAREPKDGFIAYGSQLMDQRSRFFKPGLDYMTNWDEWLDVQRGADTRDTHLFLSETRFLSTPRDLATYVRFDALYQAYLNACLILLSSEAKTQPGFPEQNNQPRTGFASFGGPHILSLVTEVATRCLKFARRQKFNWHRRARPEKISGLLTLAALNGAGGAPKLGAVTMAEAESMNDLLGGLKGLIHEHNQSREAASAGLRQFTAPQQPWLAKGAAGTNLLLAMAFPEGSPMHPAYAAGHATVAGGCVTMLKAFFKTLHDDRSPLAWDVTGLPAVESSADGSRLCDLEKGCDAGMTLEGELNKLAANISIARNMAGVHYYSDYYDSLRMGERVAVGILVEQMRSYDEKVEMVFRSFDGDLIEIKSTNPDAAIINEGAMSYRDWIARPQK
ncbi:MAG: bromoperoxidase [Pseudomonadota bacterium]